MEELPNALLKDLLSTGYFYEELKAYTETKEIGLSFYSRNYAIPHLTKILEVYKQSGETHKIEILTVAIDRLTKAKDEELADSILELKKITRSEIDTHERSLHQLGSDDKAELRACRHKSESAQNLSKLLVSIIKMFKLAEAPPKRGASTGGGAEFVNASELPASL